MGVMAHLNGGPWYMYPIPIASASAAPTCTSPYNRSIQAGLNNSSKLTVNAGPDSVTFRHRPQS